MIHQAIKILRFEPVISLKTLTIIVIVAVFL